MKGLASGILERDEVSEWVPDVNLGEKVAWAAVHIIIITGIVGLLAPFFAESLRSLGVLGTNEGAPIILIGFALGFIVPLLSSGLRWSVERWLYS